MGTYWLVHIVDYWCVLLNGSLTIYQGSQFSSTWASPRATAFPRNRAAESIMQEIDAESHPQKWTQELQSIISAALYWSKLISNLAQNHLQNRNRLTDIEKKLMVTKGEMGAGVRGMDKLGVWD